MTYRILAEIVLVLHVCFVLFVVFGGLLALCRRWVMWLHLPAVAWGILIEFCWWACPLTMLENWLRHRSGRSGYATGFLDYYISAILYTPLSPTVRLWFGLLLIAFNLVVYCFIVRQHFFSRQRFNPNSASSINKAS